MRIKRGISYTQAKRCRWCLHIGRTAYLFGTGIGKGAVLEVGTPRKLWRFRRADRNYVPRPRLPQIDATPSQAPPTGQ